jgi:hypothetical protein
MMSLILPLASVVMALASPGEGSTDGDVVSASPRAAQARLAGALADADSIDAVAVDRKHHTVTFSIERAGQAYDVIATTRRRGEVIAVAIRAVGEGTFEIGGLTWLSDTMRSTSAVARLTVDDDGAVTLVTNKGLRYMAIPGRGSGGNDEVEARWAAEWNNV